LQFFINVQNVFAEIANYYKMRSEKDLDFAAFVSKPLSVADSRFFTFPDERNFV